MTGQQVDDKLLALLNDLPYFSRLGVCLSVRISDYAAQLCGCRSSRQVDDNITEEVSNQFNLLIDELYLYIDECRNYISQHHIYKEYILSMSDDALEEHLESTLFNMLYNRDDFIFVENFLF